MLEEQFEILGAAAVPVVEAFELRAANDGVDLGAPHVVRRERKDKLGVQIGVFVDVVELSAVAVDLADHAVPAEHPHGFVKVRIVRADHAAFYRAQVVSVVEREIRREPEGAEFAILKRGPVRFADIFDQRNVASF